MRVFMMGRAARAAVSFERIAPPDASRHGTLDRGPARPGRSAPQVGALVAPARALEDHLPRVHVEPVRARILPGGPERVGDVRVVEDPVEARLDLGAERVRELVRVDRGGGGQRVRGGAME